MPKLNELDGSIEGLSESIDKLPEGAKSAITSVLENGSAGLKDLIDKVLAIPGVAEIVKPKLDELMAKISALSGKQQ